MPHGCGRSGRLVGSGRARAVWSRIARSPRARPAWSTIRRCWRWASGAELGAPAEALEALVAATPGRAWARRGQRRLRRLARPQGGRAGRPRAGAACRRASSRPDALLEETARLATRSEIVYRETGCWGVAEGAALAAVGAGGPAAGAQAQGRRGSPAPSRSPPHDLDPDADRPAAGPARRRRPRPRRPGLAHGGGRAAAGRGRGAGRLRPLSRPDRAGRPPASRATSSRSGPRSTAAAWRWSSPPRAATWPWSARATPGSTRWRRWCSSCWRAARTRPGRGSR